ncbi:MAG TPA: hypothetical protein VKB69_09905, partial [Micromonosporaceae bacterium]|nr:hypothetical protein [Micromonosporaceae bacterium]
LGVRVGYRTRVGSTDAAGIGALAARLLRDADGCEIAPGLTDAELDGVERQYGIEFADDHRAFLAAGLPVNTRPEKSEPGVVRAFPAPWPDWRHGDPADLRERLTRPVDGVLFDVEHNGLWLPGWGERPGMTAAALDTARRHLARIPTMIPVYGHRYLPGGHGTSGHPVLSVHQSDVICYGADLPDYIRHEFGNLVGSPVLDAHVTVPFWRDLL